MSSHTKAKRILIKTGRIAAKTTLFIILFFLLILLCLHIPPVQRYVRQKIVVYLENKLATKVEIGRIYIGLPKTIILENVYLEDRQKDTLFSGGSIRLDLNIRKLVFDKEVIINSAELEDITAHIIRQQGDSNFNYQFISDAFTSKDTSSAKKSSTDNSIKLSNLTLEKINLVYKDAITGNDLTAKLSHLDSRINLFDPAKLIFDISEINVSGLTANFYQFKTTKNFHQEQNNTAQTEEPLSFNFNFKKATVQHTALVYRNDLTGLSGKVNIGDLKINANNVNIAKQEFDIKSLLLNNSTASITLEKRVQSKIIKQPLVKEDDVIAATGWKIKIASLDADNNNLKYDNDNFPPAKEGIDYNHLTVANLLLRSTDISLNAGTVSGHIMQSHFKEQSGFELNQLTTSFLYSPTEVSLTDLYLKTPSTELREKLAIHYASYNALVNDIGNTRMNIDLINSKVFVKDILTFAPFLKKQPAFNNPNTTWYVNTRMSGALANLKIDRLQIHGLQNTNLDIAGTITGLPSIKNLQVNIAIRNMSSSRRDINLFIPAGTLPANVSLPERLTVKGNVQSNSGIINSNLFINTDWGDVTVNGAIQHANSSMPVYNMRINTINLYAGKIIQNKELSGPVSAAFTVSGRGYDLKTAQAKLEGVISSAGIHGYEYRDGRFSISLTDQRVAFNAAITDPNMHLSLNGGADLSMQYPSVRLEGMIDSIKLQALHFTNEPIIVRGKADGNFPQTDINNPEGKLFFTQFLFVNGEQRLKLDTVQLIAGRTDSSNFIRLSSDILTARLEGKYQLKHLGDIFQQSIQPYFNLTGKDSVITAVPYDFALEAHVTDNPALKAFIPALQKTDSLSLKSHFANNGWTALINAPGLDIGTNQIRKLEIKAGTADNAINFTCKLNEWKNGNIIQLNNTSLTGIISGNKIDFTVNSKDRKNKNKYNLKGFLQQPQHGQYEFSLNPDSLVLNYDRWNASPGNRVIINADGSFRVNDLVLSKDGQQLIVKSTAETKEPAMEVKFVNFQLAALTGFVQSDTGFARGTINGNISFTNFAKPIFTSDLSIDDLALKNDTAGNLHVLVSNSTGDKYAATLNLTGHGNDVKLAGNYNPLSADNNFDFGLDIKTLPLTTLQAFSLGKINSGEGSVAGKFTIRGNVSQPLIKGDLQFNRTSFNISMLNSRFAIDKQHIQVDEQGLRFDRFEIKDSAQNPFIINGTAATTNFTNYKFDMDVRANNFMALNSTKKDNPLFYGKLFFNTTLKLKGTEISPVVDGRLVINDKTKMTVVLPQQNSGVVDRQGIVEFVDRDAPINDSLFLVAYDSLNTSVLTGMDIAVNISVVRDAEFSLVVDEGNGDLLNVKGEAALNATINPSGKIMMTGSYELEQGSYELTFNFLKRKFDIEKGSRITWEGEPTNATVEVKASYIANAAPLDFVKNQLGDVSPSQRNTYLQKLPFNVILNMQGKLMQPQISFDITLPENKNYPVDGATLSTVQTGLQQLRQEEGEMDKQVFSLMLLNRFVSEDPFNSSTGTVNAGAIARQSASKLLTEQLNNLAGNLVNGVDINFDVMASEDYTSGERQDRTDLNVGLSKKLLDERLTVTVGSNFELEGPENSSQGASNIAGNVALDYRISKDNRYLLRAYRKNEYQGVIEGYIIETGVGFIITVDYNHFREIFRKKRNKTPATLPLQPENKTAPQQKTQTSATNLPLHP